MTQSISGNAPIATLRGTAPNTGGIARSTMRASGPAIMLAVILAALSHTSARAQEPALAAGESRWGLGVGGGIIRKPYRGYDNDTIVLPVLFYENKWISVAGAGLDLKLPSAGPVSFKLRATYALSDGYKASDSYFLAGMDKRKAGIWLGGAATWHNDIANVSAEYLVDASGNSDGQKFTLGVNRGFTLGDFRLTPRVAAVWTNDKYVDYYYGVKSSEATAGRAAYEGASTVNFEGGLRVDYALARHHMLFLDVSATRLGSKIKDSPIIERSNQGAVRLGYLYRF